MIELHFVALICLCIAVLFFGIVLGVIFMSLMAVMKSAHDGMDQEYNDYFPEDALVYCPNCKTFSMSNSEDDDIIITTCDTCGYTWGEEKTSTRFEMDDEIKNILKTHD